MIAAVHYIYARGVRWVVATIKLCGFKKNFSDKQKSNNFKKNRIKSDNAIPVRDSFF